MRCYAQQGKRGLALRQYQRCKDILQQEFGTAPGPSIQNLYLRLMGLLLGKWSWGVVAFPIFACVCSDVWRLHP